MSDRTKIHPALKHGGYSKTPVLPDKDHAEFQKHYRALLSELRPNGPLETDIVGDIAVLTWRKNNLLSMRQRHRDAEFHSDDRIDFQRELGRMEPQKFQALTEQAIQAEIAEATTIDRLMETLTVEERIQIMIDRCLKRLLLVRGVKSLLPSSPPQPSPKPQGVSGPTRTA
jgi:hypothetical protein